MWGLEVYFRRSIYRLDEGAFLEGQRPYALVHVEIRPARGALRLLAWKTGRVRWRVISCQCAVAMTNGECSKALRIAAFDKGQQEEMMIA